ncbi:hypothetical protein [Marinomonas foliarum]|uniref:Uncharacterized protein n=1 Tax=Marinomonas foliarum TaxID=491950 RepID=A0A369AD11_9GAMM|nr:hypothetical protein [Marinomonas foliarum]RCX07053.1 hypothetical protein DFP77_107153 [Marinomonas foliarum]
MKITLQPDQQAQIPQRGQTVVYLSGETDLLFEAGLSRFRIPAGGQVTLPEVFESISVKNMGSVENNAEFLLIEGEYSRLSDVSIVQIQGITNAITANVASLPAVQISQLPAVEVESLPSVQVSQLPAVEVSELPEVVKKDVSNVLTTTYTVATESVVTIPAKVGRKRLVIQAYTPSLNTTICRVSDTAKTSIEGQILAAGGGLLGELEHKHAAALKVWNPSEDDVIEIILQEEF